MQRPGYDAKRRSRKIGTADQGWRKQAQQVIPERWTSSRRFYEELTDFVVLHRDVHDRELTFIVEPARPGNVYSCTPDDIWYLLRLLPPECVNGAEGLDGIVLRQPTRKQEDLAPVWGRLTYTTSVGPLCGPAIYLEAEKPTRRFGWRRKLSLEHQAELERMRRLVSGYENERRGHYFEWGLLNMRRWVLYHTLIHEVGHWVDYLSKVVVPCENGVGEFGELWDRYHQRPQREKESFAHRFSDEWRDELIHRGAIPFARHYDEAKLAADGLDPAWFRAPHAREDEAGPPLLPFFEQRRTPTRVPPVDPTENKGDDV